MHGQHVPLGSLGDIFTARSLRCGVRCRNITVEAGAGGWILDGFGTWWREKQWGTCGDDCLGGGFKHVLFSSLFGNMIPIWVMIVVDYCWLLLIIVCCYCYCWWREDSLFLVFQSYLLSETVFDRCVFGVQMPQKVFRRLSFWEWPWCSMGREYLPSHFTLSTWPVFN